MIKTALFLSAISLVAAQEGVGSTDLCTGSNGFESFDISSDASALGLDLTLTEANDPVFTSQGPVTSYVVRTGGVNSAALYRVAQCAVNGVLVWTLTEVTQGWSPCSAVLARQDSLSTEFGTVFDVPSWRVTLANGGRATVSPSSAQFTVGSVTCVVAGLAGDENPPLTPGRIGAPFESGDYGVASFEDPLNRHCSSIAQCLSLCEQDGNCVAVSFNNPRSNEFDDNFDGTVTANAGFTNNVVAVFEHSTIAQGQSDGTFTTAEPGWYSVDLSSKKSSTISWLEVPATQAKSVSHGSSVSLVAVFAVGLIGSVVGVASALFATRRPRTSLAAQDAATVMA